MVRRASYMNYLCEHFNAEGWPIGQRVGGPGGRPIPPDPTSDGTISEEEWDRRRCTFNVDRQVFLYDPTTDGYLEAITTRL